MQLILKPIADERLQEIIVTDSRFAIGRDEGQFRHYDRSVVEKLSRRHARIFERGGNIYVADLGSSNGTTVNGQYVTGEPQQLRLKDEVQFGGLAYQVEHISGGEATTTSSRTSTEVRIVLQPVSATSGLAPIVVSAFPFLLGRYGSIFASQQDSHRKQLAQISKKHAHFFVEDGAVHIEDLGSTNGTFVSGKPLEARSRRLINGDTVAFGGDFFAYRVQTFVGKETVVSAEVSIRQLGDGTIFVEDATNFFEIYMAGDDAEAAEEADPKATAVRKVVDPVTTNAAFRFIRNLRESFRGSDPIDRRLRWTVLLAVGAVILGVAGYMYLAWPVQQTLRLYEQEQFREAAILGNNYLQKWPENEELQNLATVSLLKDFVPEWQIRMAEGEHTEAGEILQQAREIGADNPDDDAPLDALELMTRFADLELDRSNSGASIDALTDNDEAVTLYREWERQATRISNALSRVQEEIDGFSAYRSRFNSGLLELANLIDLTEPQRALWDELDDPLVDRDTTRLHQIIDNFSEQNPDAGWLQDLLADLGHYDDIEQEIASERWLAAFDRLSEAEFRTAPFTRYANRMITEVLPDAETRARYQAAAGAWSSSVQLELYEELSGQRWGEDASRMLDRNRSLLSAYFDRDPESEGYEDRLFALHARLDPDMDRLIFDQLEPEFQRFRESALEKADEVIREAEEAWNRYVAMGMLGEEHRLDPTVSEEYRELANQLSETYRLISESERVYRNLNADIPAGWSGLHDEVVEEIRDQRRIISGLIFIDAEVRSEKLALLPTS